MNEIIIKGGYTWQQDPKRDSGDRVAASGRAQTRRCFERKVKMSEEPNLDLNMLKQGRLSQKKCKPRVVHNSSLSKYHQSPRKQSSSLAGVAESSAHIEKKIDMIASSHQHEAFFKRSYSNHKQRRLYFNHRQNKIKQSSLEAIAKINATAPIPSRKPSQQPKNSSQQKMVLNLPKSQSCKGKPASNLMNPEELFEAYKHNQVYELNKRVMLRMNREKDKQFYEQAITHLFELAKHNLFHNKVRSEMPCELDVNKIVIPRRNYREEWTDKLKKYQESAMKCREESQKKSLGKEGRILKLRAKTDGKFAHSSKRNQTQFLQKRDMWSELVEKPFEPWQFESISSKFFE